MQAFLTAAGFGDIEFESLSAPMSFGATVDDALRFVADQQAGLLDRLGVDEQRGALSALRADLAAHVGERGVQYESATWLVRARRV